jgi:HEAT repeat protein
MNRIWLALVLGLTVSILGSFTFGHAQEKDKKQEPKDKKEETKDPNEFGGKSIGEWVKILREAENPKHRRAALIVLDTTGTAGRVGLTAVIEAAEKDKDVQVRIDAISLLGRLGPKTRDAMRTILFALQNDKAEQVRETAATILGGDTYLDPVSDHVNVLSAALKDSHAGTRIAVAGALRNLQKAARPAFPALLESAKDTKEHLQVRTAALHVLSRYDAENPEVLKLLLALTNQSDAAVALRETAIDGLSRAGSDGEEVVAALCKTLVDKNLELRKASAAALVTLGAKAKSSWSTVKTRFDSKIEPDSGIRNHLIRVAGVIAKSNPEAIEPLKGVIDTDDSTENRLAAIQELGELGKAAQSALPVLMRVAAQDGRAAVRDAAEKAIAQIKK